MTPLFDRIAAYEGADALMASLAREGFDVRRRKANALHESRVADVARFFADVIQGRQDSALLREALNPQHEYMVREINRLYPSLRLTETMSVTDFSQYLTVDVLDRVLYGYYNIMTIPVRQLVKEKVLNDFRTVKRLQIDGAVKPFRKQGSPGEPPEERALEPQEPITYSPDLYQGMMSVNWRAIVNDDLGIFNDMTQRLAWSWNLTLWKAITGLYVDVNGPHASLYNSTFGNQITTANGASSNNPPLDFQGLIDARKVLAKMIFGEAPIVFPGTLYLWHGPALTTTAQALLSALRADISVGGGTTNSDGFPSQRLSVNPSYVTGGLVDVEDKYIPLIVDNGTVEDTMWGLTYDPNAQPRPSIEFGVLRGFTTPQLFQKAPNTMRVGGGVDPMLGDFLTMDLDYKAVAVFGGKQIDGRSTVASTGQGS